MYKKLLVPLDGSTLCANALDPAEDIAKRYDAELILIHVVPYTPIYSEDRIGEFSEPDKTEIAVAEKFLSKRAEDLKTKGIKASWVALGGELPAQEIIEYARKNSIDLIVMTTHGRSGFSHLWLGSVTEKIIRNASEFASIFVLRCKGK
jgi:nucleotide-binding universal stress UspA family protein